MRDWRLPWVAAIYGAALSCSGQVFSGDAAKGGGAGQAISDSGGVAGALTVGGTGGRIGEEGGDGSGGMAGAFTGEAGEAGAAPGGTSGSGGGAGSGSTACESGTFACGDGCVPNAGCAVGSGSCENNGVKLCLPGGTVGCSVEAKPKVCTANASSACDPCGNGSGSAVSGTRLCDGDGCAFGGCTAASGQVLAEYAPAWNHVCGWAHDASGQNWRCETNPLSAPSCACADKTLLLPAGSYQLRVTAGFPPIDTPMTLRVSSGNTTIASQDFNVAGLAFTTHQLNFALGACTTVKLEIVRTSGKAGFVLNQITLQRI